MKRRSVLCLMWMALAASCEDPPVFHQFLASVDSYEGGTLTLRLRFAPPHETPVRGTLSAKLEGWEELLCEAASTTVEVRPGAEPTLVSMPLSDCIPWRIPANPNAVHIAVDLQTDASRAPHHSHIDRGGLPDSVLALVLPAEAYAPAPPTPAELVAPVIEACRTTTPEGRATATTALATARAHWTSDEVAPARARLRAEVATLLDQILARAAQDPCAHELSLIVRPQRGEGSSVSPESIAWAGQWAPLARHADRTASQLMALLPGWLRVSVVQGEAGPVPPTVERPTMYVDYTVVSRPASLVLEPGVHVRVPGQAPSDFMLPPILPPDRVEVRYARERGNDNGPTGNEINSAVLTTLVNGAQNTLSRGLGLGPP